MPVVRRNLIPATIEHAKVLDVDVANYTVTVVGQFARNPISGVTFMTPYQHYAAGEGIYMMPEEGSLCWICFPSDGNKAFVLGWAPANNDGDYRSRKQDLNPGDIYLGTRDENFMILRRGGIVQIGGGGLCQRIFMPVNNLITDFCENYKLQTLGGSLEWSIGLQENSSDGHTPGLLTLKAKEYSDDPEQVAELKIGSHDGDADTILSLITNASGATGASQQVSLKIDKSGDVNWVVKKDVSWDVSGTHTIKSKGAMTLQTDASLSVTAKSSMTYSAGSSITVNAGGLITMTGSPMIKLGPLVQAGGAIPVALAPPLMAWLVAHVHNIILPVPATPTTPPVVPPSPFISTTLFAS